ncbi:MAG TPA: sialidase family protein [Blastocatellia bacterium]|nr:sialidase family protein [Blastocatellia bacterium]
MTTVQKILVLVICFLFVFATAAGQVTITRRENQILEEGRFLRNNQARRGQHKAEAPEILLPELDPLAASRVVKSAPAANDALVATTPVRVNGDLLGNDSVAQRATQAEPYLHANPENPNNLLAGWQEYRFANGGARVLNYSVSFDGGLTWSEAHLPQLTVVNGGVWQRASDPWVEFGPNNRAYYTSLLFNSSSPDNAIAVSVSTDGGATWGPPVIVARATLNFNDKQALTVDTHRSSTFFGNVYVAWDINIDTNGVTTAQHLVVARSTDGGATYGRPVRTRKKGANIGVIPRVGPDGTLYIMWAGGSLSGNNLSLFFSKSTDGGVSFTPKKKLTRLRADGQAGLRTGAILPSFAVDPTTGDLYVAWQDSRFTGVDHATIMISRDKGETWTEPLRVSDGPDNAPAFTVSVAANSNRGVAVSYYSLQNDPQRRFIVDQYVRISEDGGRSFQPSIRVTSSSFDARFAAQAGGLFLGDYAGLTGAGRRFHLLWIDTRDVSPLTGAPQPDVFTARTEE